jgi:hypothetical protein
VSETPSSWPFSSRLPSCSAGLGSTPFPTRAPRAPGCQTTRRGEMAPRTNVNVAGSVILERGHRDATGLKLAERPYPGCPVQRRATRSGTEALRLAAAHAPLEGLAAPEAPDHGRATKAQSAHTRAASRITVAGSRIMFGSGRWLGRSLLPRLSPTSRAPRPLCGCQCGRRPERW